MAKLGEVCKLNMGQSPDSSSYNDTGDGIPFFQGNADFGEVHPNIRVWCNAPTKIAHPGEILISVRAPIGAMNIADCECCIGRGLASISADEAVCTTKYLWYGISSKIEELNAKGTGSTFKAVNKKTLEETEIPIRDLMEQERIAAKLDSVTALITLRKRQVKKLDELVKARFVEMFGDCKTNPKNWKTKALEKIANVGSSKRVFVEELQDSGIPFYRGTEIGALAEKKAVIPALFITGEHYKQLCETTGKPQKGDLLMPSICPDGRIWIVDTNEPFYFKDGRVLWVHLTSANYNSVFLLYTLKDRIMTDYASIASGTTFAELKIFALKKCKIFDVPLELQNQFANFVERVDQQKQTVQQSLEKLELMKKALMQEYFG